MAGAVLLASFGFFAPAYAEPSSWGPLSINGTLAVLGPLAADDSLMVPGDIQARGPITAIWIERIPPDDSAARRRWGITRFTTRWSRTAIWKRMTAAKRQGQALICIG